MTQLHKIYKDNKGHYRTYSLFLETHHNSNEEPVYTLKDYDVVENGKVYTSAKRIYIECEDPTGYKAAIKLVGCWEGWEKLLGSSVFAKCIENWNKELEVRLKSKAIESLIEVALNEGPKGQNAAKYLAEYGWERPSSKSSPGRPKRKQEEKKDSASSQEIEEDLYILKNLKENEEDSHNGGE